MKVGDTIKCNGMLDLWNTKICLERQGIYTDQKFPHNEFTLVVYKVQEKQHETQEADL